MAVFYLGDPRFRAFDSNGNPLTGGKLNTFAEASSTPKAAFTDNTGLTPHPNPIILDANGEAEVWLNGKYKLQLDDALDVLQWTMDGIAGVGFQDAAAAVDEWTENTDVPTHIDNTNFSVPGDKRTTYQVGRRVRATISAGTIYGTATVSAFTTVTTVTVVWDAGNLDSGLSGVAVGFLAPTDPSIPGVTLSEDDWTFQGNVTIDGTQTFTGDQTHTGRITADGILEPGDFIYSMLPSKSGFFLCRNQTVGSAASGATEANAAYDLLFAALWDNMADAEAPVSSGRGASAAADFAANKTITLPDGRGRQLLAKDNMGGASANVVVDTEADTMGDLGGAEDTTLVLANLAGHTHVGGAHIHGVGSYAGTFATLTVVGASNSMVTQSGFQTAGTWPVTITGSSGSAGAVASASTGSGSAFGVMNPYLSLNLFVRY